MNDESNIITSRLSRKFSRDGMTIEILIHRGEKDDAWVLEVVNQEGASTVWEDTFDTEQDALNEVFQTIAREGIGCFLQQPRQTLQ